MDWSTAGIEIATHDLVKLTWAAADEVPLAAVVISSIADPIKPMISRWTWLDLLILHRLICFVSAP